MSPALSRGSMPIMSEQQQLQIAEQAVVGDHTDVVWLNRQHGLLVRPASPSDIDGRFDLIVRDGELWAVVGTTHSR
jgi:hypothetical protein